MKETTPDDIKNFCATQAWPIDIEWEKERERQRVGERERENKHEWQATEAYMCMYVCRERKRVFLRTWMHVGYASIQAYPGYMHGINRRIPQTVGCCQRLCLYALCVCSAHMDTCMHTMHAHTHTYVYISIHAYIHACIHIDT